MAFDLHLYRFLEGLIYQGQVFLSRVRYIGIESPETVHPTRPVECFGPEASTLNTTLVDGRSVYLELDAEVWDPFGRLLAHVYLDADGYAMVNAMLLTMGFAIVSPHPPNVRYFYVFESLQETARATCLGLWQACEHGCLRRDCLGCLDFLNITAQQSDFEMAAGIGETLTRRLLNARPFTVDPCTAEAIVATLDKDVDGIGHKLADGIIRRLCPWLICR